MTAMSSHPKYALAALGALKEADYNPRTITEVMLTALEKGIEEYGFVEPLVIRFEDNLILGGHQRVKAYRRLLARDHMEGGALVKARTKAQIAKVKVPVIQVKGLSDEKAKTLNLALNKISGDWDYPKLTPILQELQEGEFDFDVTLTGFSEDEIDELLEAGGPGGGSTDDPNLSQKKDKLRFSFTVANKSQADYCRKVLRQYGMSGTGNAAMAFVEALKVAAGTGKRRRSA